MRQQLWGLIPRDQLDIEAWPAYVLDHFGLIIYVNRSWDREALAGGGPMSAEVLGTQWLDYIDGEEPKAWHEALLRHLLRSPAGHGRGCVQACDCNTSDRYRLFSTRFSPMEPPGDGPAGVVVVTHLLEDVPIGARYPTVTFDEPRFLHPDGVLRQCGGCRRMRVLGSDPGVWEFVPEVVKRPRPNTSHDICDPCRELYYGDLCRGAAR